MTFLNSKADKLSSYISLISVGIIISGIVFNYQYYHHFNIVITEYIDLSESLLMFIPLLIEVFQALVTVVILLFLNVLTTFIGGLVAVGSLPLKLMLKRVIIFSPIVIVLYLILHFLFSPYKITIETFVPPLIGILAYSGIQFAQYQTSLNKPLREYYKIYLIVIVILFLGYSELGTLLKIDTIEQVTTNIPYRFTFTDSSTLKSDSIHSFIGQTKNYCFIYNRNDKRTQVLSRANIKEMYFAEPKESNTLFDLKIR